MLQFFAIVFYVLLVATTLHGVRCESSKFLERNDPRKAMDPCPTVLVKVPASGAGLHSLSYDAYDRLLTPSLAIGKMHYDELHMHPAYGGVAISSS